MNYIKRLFRLIVRPLYMMLYKLQKNKIDLSRDGASLKMGISAVVAMKNEEYTLPFCLESLIGFANQIIIIDNGSEDDSLNLAKKFKSQFEDKVEVDIIEMPGALHGDCREAGLKATRYQWHLRWDADMIAHTDGEFDMKKLREKALSDNTPRTIQLPRINLTGDLMHVVRAKDWDAGEPILMWFNEDIKYQEFGKFDAVRVPKYFSQVKENINYYFHCQGLKSDVNLMHRFHYFKWRELFNSYTKSERPKEIEDYDVFVKNRNMFLFGTNEPCSLKYRYQRQLVHTFGKINIDKYGYYPKVLREEMTNKNQRFLVEYTDEFPYIRVDFNDKEMVDYIPIKSDLEWKVESFFENLLKEQ